MIATLARHDIERLLPQKGAMCLIDAALECTPEAIVCSADASRRDHPLREAQGVPAVHAIEYGAQAAALHRLMLGQQSGSVTGGLMLQLRDVQFSVEWLDRLPQPLQITARCAMSSSEAARYRFEIHAAGSLASCGELTLRLT
jgi:predicted hotdog family 3-hydroxylacyl-ACP dehydratase